MKKIVLLSSIISIITTFLIFILGIYYFGYIYGLVEVYTKSSILGYICDGIILLLIFSGIFYVCYKLFSKKRK